MTYVESGQLSVYGEGPMPVPYVTETGPDAMANTECTTWVEAQQDGTRVAKRTPSICFTMHWDVDVDLLTPETFEEAFLGQGNDVSQSLAIAKFEEVSFYYIQDALAELGDDDIARMDPHYKLLHAWMQQQVKDAHTGTLRHCQPSWLSATPEQKDAAIAFCKNSGPDGQALCIMGANMTRLMRKEVVPLNLMLQMDMQSSPGSEIISSYVRMLSHKHPDLNILEVGSGTSFVAGVVLKDLGKQLDEVPRFSSYDFACVSGGLLEKVRGCLKDWGGLVGFRGLDIEKDPASQGFEERSYDMVILSLMNLRDMRTALQHVRKILKPGGKLAFVDIKNRLMRQNIAFGHLPGWWVGTTAKQEENEWNDFFKETGFSGVKFCRQNSHNVHEASYQVMVFEAAEEKHPETSSSIPTTLVIVPEESSGATDLILRKMSKAAKGLVYSVSVDSIPDTAGKVCLFLAEIEQPMMHTINERQFESIKQAAVKAKGVLWVAKGGAIDSPIPESNLITGLGRTIRREHPQIKFVTLDLDLNSTTEQTADVIQRLYSYTMAGVRDDRTEDFEYASRNGTILIPRIVEDHRTNRFIAKDIIHDYPLSLHQGASYLLVGGLGGLGRSMGAWMASHGAKHLIFLSRSGTDRPEAKGAISALNALGVQVAVYKCDVGDKASLDKTIQQCREELPPIKGVIHGGMVLRNSTFKKMGHESWKQTLRPKVSGTNNLCQAFSGRAMKSLDFFIILSSSVGVIGNYGQGNYAAASTFQDAIAYYYASKPDSLPIVSLDLGMILGAGYVAENSNAAAALRKLGIMGISQAQFLSMVKATILELRRAQPHCQIMTGLGTKAMVSEDGSWEDGEEYTVPFYFQDARFSHLLQMDRRMRNTVGHGDSA